MTGPGLHHIPRNVSSSRDSSASSDRGPTKQHRRPPAPLAQRLSHVIDIRDATRLVDCARVERELRFQHLVRRYISQIQYGCKSAFCTTPTCLSCNKRLNTRPFRAPTQLTARALAYYLASQDDPLKGLCPHEFKVPPHTLEIHGVDDVVHVKEGHHSRWAYIVPPPTRPESSRRLDATSSVLNSLSLDKSMQGNHEDEDHVEKMLTLLNERHQKKKDIKSLGQNLYDTVTIIYSYSKHIPNPLSVFSALRCYQKSPQDTIERSQDFTVMSPSMSHAALPSPALPEHANGHVVSAQVNGRPMQTVTQHSHGEGKMSHLSNSPWLNPDALGNSQPILKLRNHSPEGVTDGRGTTKAAEPSSLDGIVENSTAHASTMKTNSIVPMTPNGATFGPSSICTPVAKQDGRPKKDGNDIAPTLPVAALLDCDTMDQLKEEIYHGRQDKSAGFTFVMDYDVNGRVYGTPPFVNRSIFYSLSDVETLLQSFHETDNAAFKNSPMPHLNSTRLAHTFRDWNRRNGSLIFDSLWIAVEALFTPPPELDIQKSPHLKASRKAPSMDRDSSLPSGQESCGGSGSRYLSDEEAAHIVMICIHALTSLVPVGWPHTWAQLRKFRSWGIILPDAPAHTDFTDAYADPWLSIIDELEYEPALRLADRLLRGIGARMCFAHILAPLDAQEKSAEQRELHGVQVPLVHILVQHLIEVERLASASKAKMKTSLNYQTDPGWTVTAAFMEWLRTIIIKKWDGKAEVNKWSSVGASILLLSSFNTEHEKLNLRLPMFFMPFLNERIDNVEEPIRFSTRRYHPNSFHVFDHPWLFQPEYIVGYFRTINFTTMYTHYERTERSLQLQRGFDQLLRSPYRERIRKHMKVTFDDYLVLDVSREHTLEETLNQLWGQERRMLLKPLKVKMGLEAGEVGLDQGGVTYEFFRVVLSEAFKPGTGMFTTDSQSRMIWFQPASLEADWKYEMLGILFSLAVYNGITLPVTFPIALYYNLLGQQHLYYPKDHYPASTEYIRDGWPELARSFDELLSWNDGDVADVFLRSYSFSFDAFGRRIDVDMQAFDRHPSLGHTAWPATSEDTSRDIVEGPYGPTWGFNTQRPELSGAGWERPNGMSPKLNEPSETDDLDETPLVTNTNREDFVKDYIFWLTFKSVAPQLLAFRKGFRTCLDPKSLQLFNPHSLEALVEGTQIIDTAAWKAATRYEEGYTASHPTIVDFWSVVDNYSNDDRRRLLEFVTASERVPITGFEGMNFHIGRHGPDTERLPTSSTCFGKLMLPQYRDRKKLKRKLDLAIQNSKGFGVV